MYLWSNELKHYMMHAGVVSRELRCQLILGACKSHASDWLGSIADEDLPTTKDGVWCLISSRYGKDIKTRIREFD